MHPAHQQLLTELQAVAPAENTSFYYSDSYILSGHQYYGVPVPTRRAIAKRWVRTHQYVSLEDFVCLLDSLYQGNTHEEKTLASYLLKYQDWHRATLDPTKLTVWLDELVGWAEVDALCQNVFTAADLLENWHVWSSLIKTLSQSQNIYKRRASLVLLTGPTHRNPDPRLHDLALAMVTRLAHERDIIITKAVSWLLREMLQQQPARVSSFIKTHRETLPAIAVREVTRKLKTGRK